MATWTEPSKSSSSFSNESKTLYNSFLLLESGDYVLQENGDKIILEQSTASGPTFTNSSKTASVFVNQSKS